MGEIAHPGAAPFLLDRDAQQAKLAHWRPQVAWKIVAAIDLGGARRDLVAGKVRYGFAQPVEVFAEPEIEACPGIWDHARCILAAEAELYPWTLKVSAMGDLDLR